MLGEEQFDQALVRELFRTEGNQDGLGMPGHPGADLLVGRVGGDPVLVSDRGRVDTVEPPEQALGAPEAAHREVSDLDAIGKGRLERRAEHPMGARNGEGSLLTARQCLLGGGNRGFRLAEEHSGMSLTPLALHSYEWLPA